MPPPDHRYPDQDVEVLPVADIFQREFPKPLGHAEEWPPIQVRYIQLYLEQLGCKTAVLETHYIDRDFIHDVAVFYSRSLRSYPNYCRRIHFFAEEIDTAKWRRLVCGSIDPSECTRVTSRLQASYLGYLVVRPLPGVPVGRTVLKTYGPKDGSGNDRRFPAVREYGVHIGPFHLTIEGLAFQQQDRGVSACATTALWSALQRVGHIESLGTATPADITEAASRYLLADGRPLPSEGLSVHQICEAIRDVGLSPVVIGARGPDFDVGQFMGYVSSGFAPVLGLQRIEASDGHAVCAVGMKLGPLKARTDAALHHVDGASRLRALYVHDDRLGPYATADVVPYTTANGAVRTALWIQWPDKTEAEHSLLTAVVVPVPVKVRLSVARMRAVALVAAEIAGNQLPEAEGCSVFNCRYERSTEYRSRALGFGLSESGVFDLTCRLALSRYLGLIEISSPTGTALFDVLLDSTETEPNPSVLAWVRRDGLKNDTWLEALARILGGRSFG